LFHTTGNLTTGQLFHTTENHFLTTGNPLQQNEKSVHQKIIPCRQTLSFSNISQKPFPKIQNPIHQSKYQKTFYPSVKTKTAQPFQMAKRFIFSKKKILPIFKIKKTTIVCYFYLRMHE
jgi:hypothetical protein